MYEDGRARAFPTSLAAVCFGEIGPWLSRRENSQAKPSKAEQQASQRKRQRRSGPRGAECRVCSHSQTPSAVPPVVCRAHEVARPISTQEAFPEKTNTCKKTGPETTCRNYFLILLKTKQKANRCLPRSLQMLTLTNMRWFSTELFEFPGE